ncbi:Calcium-dependent lipid-binding (CaLB domain) family protein isoform 2 [Hibiscus syriacus]|uniref:Calcium-dependent lipid-binding (CaLB domain) family protein isoform 2 n=1 Tax=Hibiscus syriacus TaxID=106335 RepID=A0A6A3BHD5_HIBSY|nr:Calcium-dependent lipid-binding (CaLB domain) family protein isoform 2 [Hibiscus syriacus]
MYWAIPAIPVLSMGYFRYTVLKKLLTVDFASTICSTKKIVLDFQKGKAVGPIPNDLESGEIQEEKKKDFVGELSVTLVDARKLSYVFYVDLSCLTSYGAWTMFISLLSRQKVPPFSLPHSPSSQHNKNNKTSTQGPAHNVSFSSIGSGYLRKTDPYVTLTLGDQVIHSKKNSQTAVTGPTGEPIWNQDFHLLVANPRKEKLCIQVNDCLGFADLIVGTGEVDLGPLQDTVPTVVLQGGWGVFRKRSAGEVLLRLTYKAYVEDEEDDTSVAGSVDTDASDDELSDSDEPNVTYEQGLKQITDETDKESFMDVLAALIVSEEFQGIVSSEPGSKYFDGLSRRTRNKSSDDISRTGSLKQD